MGARSFNRVIQASSAGKAFDELHDSATYEYGHDSYNGTISTCSMGRCIKSYKTYSKKNAQEAQKIIENMGCGEKYRANYIDLGISHYEIREVKKTNREYTAKYKQKFVVRDISIEGYGKVYDKFDTKPKADALAIKLSLEGKEVCVMKQMIRLSGNDTVAEFDVKVKSQKTKPKLKPNEKRIIVPIHVYCFFGWAAE